MSVYEHTGEISALTANDAPGYPRPLILDELRSTCILRQSKYSEGVSSDEAPAYHDALRHPERPDHTPGHTSPFPPFTGGKMILAIVFYCIYYYPFTVVGKCLANFPTYSPLSTTQRRSGRGTPIWMGSLLTRKPRRVEGRVLHIRAERFNSPVSIGGFPIRYFRISICVLL